VTTEDEATFLPQPRSLRELVGRRIDALAPPARALAEAGAVLGREFDVTLATAIAGLDEARRLDATDQLLTCHVVQDVRGRVVRFVHDKLREVTYALTARERQRRLHGDAAAALEARHAEDGELPKLYATLADHCAAAGLDEKELDYRGKAGAYALHGGAHAEAHALLTRSLELDDRLGHPAERIERARW